MADINYSRELQEMKGCDLAKMTSSFNYDEMHFQLANMREQNGKLAEDSFADKKSSLAGVLGKASALVQLWWSEYQEHNTGISQEGSHRLVTNELEERYATGAQMKVSASKNGQLLFENIYDANSKHLHSSICRSSTTSFSAIRTEK